MSVPTPQTKITYNGKDISRAMDKYLVNLVYFDRTEVESDEIEVMLDDTEGKWSNQWYPEMGAKLTLEIGYLGKLIPCGEFEIDEVKLTFTGQGRHVYMKALSAIVSQPLRTKRKQAYENITLKRLAQTVAARAHLTVSGSIENIQLGRITQFDETDLAFLLKQAQMYGYVFNVKSGKLVFTKLGELYTRKSVDSIGPDRISSVSLTDATGRTYAEATQKYYNPSNGKIVQFDQKAKKGADKFVTESYTENKQQAELKAKAKVAKILASQVRGSLTLWVGTPLLVAGNNIELVKIGRFSGLYNIESSSHNLSPDGGYQTSIEVIKVGDISTDKY